MRWQVEWKHKLTVAEKPRVGLQYSVMLPIIVKLRKKSATKQMPALNDVRAAVVSCFRWVRLISTTKFYHRAGKYLLPRSELRNFWHKWSTRQGDETVNFEDQEVKGQGHTRPKLDLKAWRRHHSRPIGIILWTNWNSGAQSFAISLARVNFQLMKGIHSLRRSDGRLMVSCGAARHDV